MGCSCRERRSLWLPEAAVDPEELAAAVKTGDPERLRCWGKPIDVLVSGLRHALTAADGAMLGAAISA
jgi:hypothetical protein